MVIRPNDNGTFVAYVPAIPGCHSRGRTPEEARAEIINVFEMIEEEHALEVVDLDEMLSPVQIDIARNAPCGVDTIVVDYYLAVYK